MEVDFEPGVKYYWRIRVRTDDSEPVVSDWSAYGQSDDDDNNWFELQGTSDVDGDIQCPVPEVSGEVKVTHHVSGDVVCPRPMVGGEVFVSGEPPSQDPFTPGTKYYWRIRVRTDDSSPVESDWSAFAQTDDDDNNWFILGEPSQLVNGDLETPLPEISGEVRTIHRVSGDVVCPRPMAAGDVINYTPDPGAFTPGTKYYWRIRVRADDTAETTSEWSAYAQTDDDENNWFILGEGESLEADGDLECPVPEIDGSVRTIHRVAGDVVCPRPMADGDVDWTVDPALVPGTRYYWRMRSRDETNDVSDWSIYGQMTDSYNSYFEIEGDITGALECPVPTASGEVQVRRGVTGDLECPVPQASGQVHVPLRAIGDVVCPTPQASGEVKITHRVAGALVCPVPMASGDATTSKRAAGSLECPRPVASGSVKRVHKVSGALVCPRPVADGTPSYKLDVATALFSNVASVGAQLGLNNPEGTNALGERDLEFSALVYPTVAADVTEVIVQLSATADFAAVWWDSGWVTLSAPVSGSGDRTPDFSSRRVSTNGRKWYWRMRYRDSAEGRSPWSAWDEAIDGDNNFFVMEKIASGAKVGWWATAMSIWR